MLEPQSVIGRKHNSCRYALLRTGNRGTNSRLRGYTSLLERIVTGIKIFPLLQNWGLEREYTSLLWERVKHLLSLHKNALMIRHLAILLKEHAFLLVHFLHAERLINTMTRCWHGRDDIR